MRKPGHHTEFLTEHDCAERGRNMMRESFKWAQRGNEEKAGFAAGLSQQWFMEAEKARRAGKRIPAVVC